MKLPVPIVLRAEVRPGTEGAVPYSYANHPENVMWFGEARPFYLEDVRAAESFMGGYEVQFVIAEDEADAFHSFTGSLVQRCVAIEVDGSILTAPIVNEALPGVGVISGGSGGFTEQEASDLVATLRGGAQS